jgi:hypothetical protein
MLRVMNRKRLLAALNKRFSEREIGNTAKVARSLRGRTGLGRLSEALGIIPKDEAELWRKSTGRIPIFIATALNAGIREHLKAISSAKTAKFAGPKALRIDIVDGNQFGLQIVQHSTHTAITVTMRNRPLSPALKKRR